MKTNDFRYILASRNGYVFSLGDTVEPYSTPHKSLCIFFWQMMFGVFTIYVDASMLLGICSSLIVFVAAFATWMQGGEFEFYIEFFDYVGNLLSADENIWPSALYYISCLVGLAAWLLLTAGSIAIGACYAIGYVYDNWRNKFPNSYNQEDEKEPSILIQFIKAKKSKVCPTLTFEDA